MQLCWCNCGSLLRASHSEEEEEDWDWRRRRKRGRDNSDDEESIEESLADNERIESGVESIIRKRVKLVIKKRLRNIRVGGLDPMHKHLNRARGEVSSTTTKLANGTIALSIKSEEQ